MKKSEELADLPIRPLSQACDKEHTGNFIIDGTMSTYIGIYTYLTHLR